MAGLSEGGAGAGRFCPICGLQTDAELCPQDHVPTVRADFDAPDDPAIGRLIAGRFRVERFIGQGGTGRVYAATQLSIGRECALKLLQPHHVRDRKQVRRFYREARAATRLTSPHVVKVFDFGVDDDTRTPFIAMELLKGETLAELLHRQGAFTPWDAARVGAQIARALAEAGDAGIVHRDLKPANIVVVDAGDGTGVAKVADFGVAKDLIREDTEQLTQQGAAIGTPAYMAPEQVSGGEVSAQTDLYALGCILYELVSLRRPFDGEASAALLVDHLLRPAPPLPDPLPTGAPLPRALADLLDRLLAKAPADRPPNAKAVALALDALTAERPVTLPTGPTLAHGIAARAPTPGTQTDAEEPIATGPSAVPAAPPPPAWAMAPLGPSSPGETPAERPSRPGIGLLGIMVLLLSSAVAIVLAVVLVNALTAPAESAPSPITPSVAAAPTPTPRPTPTPKPAPAPSPARAVGERAPPAPPDSRPGHLSDGSLAGLPPEPLELDELVVRGGAARVVLHLGEPRRPVVEGDATRIDATVEEGTLTLTVGVDPDDTSQAPLVFHVWQREWRKVRVTGSSTLVSEGVLAVEQLSLALSGSARAALDLRGEALTLSLRGSADATLRGKLDRLDVRMGGAARLEASALVANEVSLAASGTSEGTVHPVQSLDARNDGAGEIIYLGEPPELTKDGKGIRRREH